MPIYVNNSNPKRLFIKGQYKGIRYFRRTSLKKTPLKNTPAGHQLAIKTEEEILHKIDLEIFVPGEDEVIPTFEELFNAWFKHWSINKEASTIKTQGSKYILHILHRFKGRNKTLYKLTNADFMDWYVSFDKENFTKKYKNAILSTFRRIIKFADDIYGIKVKYIYLLPTFKSHVTSKRKEKVTYDETQLLAFLEALKGEKMYYVYYLVAFFSGLRPGELRALQLKDFNYEERTIQVTKAVTNKTDSGHFEIKTTKTGEERIVYIPRFVAKTLYKYIKNNHPSDDPTAFIFYSARAGVYVPVTETTLRRYSTEAAKIANLPQIDNYEFRHSFGTLASEVEDGNLTAVASMMGHQSITTTSHYYDHSGKKRALALVEKIEERIADSNLDFEINDVDKGGENC